MGVRRARTRTTPLRAPWRGRIGRWKLDNRTQDDDAADVAAPIDLVDDLTESCGRQRQHEHDRRETIHEDPLSGKSSSARPATYPPFAAATTTHRTRPNIEVDVADLDRGVCSSLEDDIIVVTVDIAAGAAQDGVAGNPSVAAGQFSICRARDGRSTTAGCLREGAKSYV